MGAMLAIVHSPEEGAGYCGPAQVAIQGWQKSVRYVVRLYVKSYA